MWQTSDYEKAAKEIVDSVQATAGLSPTPPQDLVIKLARDRTMNSDQIRRLTTATNRAIFAAKYAEHGGMADRRVDFPVLDPDAIIATIRSSTPEAKTAFVTGSAYPDLPDPRVPRVREKTAFEHAEATLGPEYSRVTDAHLSKIAEDANVEAGILNIQWAEALSPIVDTCRGAYHDHVAFEKNAFAVLGDDVYTELNAIRARLGREPLPHAQEKYAAALDYMVGQADENTRRLATAKGLRTAYFEKMKIASLAKAERAHHKGMR